MRSISTTFLLIVTVVLVLSSSGTYAFGAGDIPDFSFLNGDNSPSDGSPLAAEDVYQTRHLDMVILRVSWKIWPNKLVMPD